MGSAALKPAWRNYSALELDATCVVWSPETLSYYLTGCPKFYLWTNHSPLAQAIKKELRTLTPRMQKFRESIQAYNVCIFFVRGCHNNISDALSRALVGGPEAIKRAQRGLRGHASYAYNRVMPCITGDICKEVIEDPALDEMWEAAEKDDGYQKVAETIESKKELTIIKTLSKAAIKEYVRFGIERMLVIKKGDTMIVVKDQTRIVVPKPCGRPCWQGNTCHTVGQKR